MIEDINSDAIEVNLDNLILPARLYRIVENDPAAEKRKQAFLERWGLFNINTNTAGTQQPNGITDPATKEEEDVELCSFEDLAAITLPSSLFRLQDYSDIFSSDTWNNILDEEDRKKLEGYLPRIDDCSSQDIIKDLFEGISLQQFGIDPIKQFTKHLRGGVYSKDVYGYKKFTQTMLDQLHSLKIKRDRLNLLQKSLTNDSTTEYMTDITHDLYYEQIHDKPTKKKERSGGVIQKLTDDPKKSRKRKEREQTSSDDENGRESKRQKLTESKKKDTSRSQMKKSHPPPPPIKPFSFFASVYELFNLNDKEASTDLVTSYIDENPKVVGLVPIQYSTNDFVEMALKFLEDPPDLRATTSGKTATFNSFVEYDDESGTWRWLATDEAVPYFDQLEQVFFFAVTRGQVDYAKNQVRLQLHSKQTNTILPEDLNPEEYRRQERERYKNPEKPFTYRTQGNSYTVAPLKETGKAREHTILKSDRPSQVTILSLVRDSAARLPGGLGTKQDVVTLFRQSQYLIDNAAETQIHSAVRGALDRLQAEADPPVRYDADLKLWLYLHRSRSEQDWLDIVGGKFGPPVVVTTVLS